MADEHSRGGSPICQRDGPFGAVPEAEMSRNSVYCNSRHCYALYSLLLLTVNINEKLELSLE